MQEKLSGINTVAMDVETISLKDTTPVGFSLAISPTESFYITLYPEPDEAMPWDIICSPAVKKVFHNSLFDLSAMEDYEIYNSNIEDTMLMAMLLGYPAGLVDLTALLLPGMEVHSMGEYLTPKMTTLDLSVEQVSVKCCQDSQATFALFEELLHLVDLDYYSVEKQLIPILMKMSSRGLLIDHEVREQLEIQYTEDMNYYEALCVEAGMMKPGSPQQIGMILAKRGNMLPLKRKFNERKDKWEMKISTRAEDLEKLSDPLAAAVIGYKHARHTLSNYLVPWRSRPRAYTRWHLDAITGRVSSTSRNLQNIPSPLRSMFLPDNECFTIWDASQMELRCLAYLSQDKTMLEVFSHDPESPDGNIHQKTANYLNILKKTAKNVNFAMIYGSSDEGLAETAHIPSIRRAHQLRESWFNTYPDAARFIKLTQDEGWNDGYITTLYGRKIAMPTNLESRAAVNRKSINYRIQGSAAEIIKRAMIRCRHLPILLQVHDELIGDGDLSEEVRSLDLEHMAPLHIPYQLIVSERWT